MTNNSEQAMQQKWQNYSSLKSLQILSCIIKSDKPLGVSAISEITGLSAASVHRILQELLACQFVEKDDTEKTYFMGVSAWSLALNIKDSYYLITAAQNEMARLNELSKETVHLIKLDDLEGVYLSKLDAKNHIGLRSRVGGKMPLYATSAGKLILSGQNKQWLDRYFTQIELRPTSENTICDESALRRELEIVKMQCYAMDNREHHPDIVCVAAPIFDSSKKISCAISISAPDYRMSLDKATSLIKEVQKSAQIISEKLGGDFPIKV